MNKPFSLVYEDFKRELADLINNSALPPFIIEAILQNYLFEINSIVKRQYQSDKAQYEMSLINETKEAKKEREIKEENAVEIG